jgi:diacylglycerol kinase family enzyme
MTRVVGAERRLAAVLALMTLAAALAIGVLGAIRNPVKLGAYVVTILLTVVAAWYAFTRRGHVRAIGRLVAALGLLTIVVGGLATGAHGLWLLVVVLLGLASTAAARYALRRDPASLKAAPTPGAPVPPARRGVLIMNPRSGGGKAERFALADECRRRGIEPIVLSPGDDLLQLARDAIARGADVIGMAGGDGSQALVASVASEHDVPHVCIPAGTRNHFALDLGLDRDDVVGALDAFGEAVERRMDLATVGDRVFVNNVSLGIYAKIVQSPEYRDAKRQTAEDMLPDLLGPDAEPFDLRFDGPDGTEIVGAQIIQVSNDPYVLTRLGGFGTRARVDTGELGIVAARIGSASEAAQVVALEAAGRIARFRGWHEWTAPAFEVRSGSPIEAGVDGEALVLEPPLVFRSLPGALRVRLPSHAPGHSPAALRPPSFWWTITALLGTVAGRAPDVSAR